MFATVRRYAGLDTAAVEALADHAADIAALLVGVPGCAGGQLIRTREGVIIVMVGDDEPALVEAGRRFVAWTHRRIPTFRPAAQPDLWAGDVLLGTAAASGEVRPAESISQRISKRRSRHARPAAVAASPDREPG